MRGIELSNEALRALRKLGFRTLISLSLLFPSELAGLVGIPEDLARELIRQAREKLPIKELKEFERVSERITTGCKALDEMLGGGVETGAITELVGEFGTGKTQICHQLCVTVQLPPEKGGLSARAVYIDTEGTFRPERIIQMANRFKLNPSSTLKNVYYARVRNLAEQIACLVELKSLVSKGVKLIAVDSVVAHFKGAQEGPDLLTRVHELALYLNELRSLAVNYNVAVVLANRVVAVPIDSGRVKVSRDPFVSMFVDYRVSLHKVRENIRRATLAFRKYHARTPVLFKITEEGVIDLS